MIQGTEEEIRHNGVTFFIRRNEQCEGVYIEYDPKDKMHVAVGGFGAYMEKRLELLHRSLDDGPTTEDGTLRFNAEHILTRLRLAFEAGEKSKIDEIKGVLEIVEPRR